MLQLTRLHMLSATFLLFAPFLPALAQDNPDRLAASDIFNLQFASDPQISPDGKRIVYVRAFADIMSDKRLSNLWSVNFDGLDNRGEGAGGGDHAVEFAAAVVGHDDADGAAVDGPPRIIATGEAFDDDRKAAPFGRKADVVEGDAWVELGRQRHEVGVAGAACRRRRHVGNLEVGGNGEGVAHVAASP